MVQHSETHQVQHDSGGLPRWPLLGVLTLVQTGMSGLQLSLIALLPVIKRAEGLSVTRTAVLASAVSAGALLGAVPAGQVVNRFGERRALTGGCALAAVALLVASTVPNMTLMLLPLILAGVGVVFSHPAGVRTILRHFAVNERGAAIAIRQTAVPLGGALGALVLPPLAGVVGWRGALVAVGCLSLALAALSWRTVADAAPADSRTAAAPLRQVLGQRAVLLGVLLCLCLNVGQVAVVTFLALFVHEGLGYSVGVGSVLLALVQVTGITGRLLWGVLSDRVWGGARRPLLVVLGIGGTLTLGAMALLGDGTGLPLLVLITVAAGLTAVGWNGLGIALTTEAAGLANAATAMSGIVTVVAFINAAVPIAGGRIIDSTGSYRAVWVAATAVMLLTPLLALLIPERISPRRLDTVPATPPG